MRSHFLIALLLIGCKPDADTGPDANTGDDTGDAPEALSWADAGEPEIAPPNIPWLADGDPEVAPPNRTCPEGWGEEALEHGGHACVPWPASGREECEDATSMHLPGTEGCAPVGSSCAEDGWPADAASADLFVSAGGSGDGSPEAPFGSISEALAAADAGATIAVSVGTYDEALQLDQDVTILGACPAQTVLTWSAATADDADGAVVRVASGTVKLLDLQVADSAAMGVRVDGGSVSLEGVVIHGVSNRGLYLEGSDVVLDSVLITDVEPHPADDTHGEGIFQGDGSTLVATGLGIARNHYVGVWTEGDSSFDLSDVVVFDMAPQASDNARGVALRGSNTSGEGFLRRISVQGGHDYAVAAMGGADLSVEDAWFSEIGDDALDGVAAGGLLTQSTGDFTAAGITVEGSPSFGVSARSSDADHLVGDVVFEDMVVRRSYRSEADTDGGIGIGLLSPSSASVSRVVVEDSEGAGVLVYMAEGQQAAITDLRVSGSGPKGGNGAGFVTEGPGDTAVTRAIFEDNAIFGVLSIASPLSLADVAVRLVDRDSLEDEPGMGISVESAPVTLSSVLVENTGLYAVGINNDAEVAMSDIVVRDLQPWPAYEAGLGINNYVEEGHRSSISLQRAEISGTIGGSVSALRSDVDLADVRVLDTASVGGLGTMGYGMDFVECDVTMARVSIGESHGAGLWLMDSSVVAEDLAIHGVVPQECVADLCPDETAASGVYVDGGSSAELQRVLVSEAEGVGLQIQGSASLAVGLVRGNGLGVDRVDGTLEATDLTLEDNGQDEASEAQPAPTSVWQ